MRYLGMHQQSHQYWLNIMNQSKYKELASDCYNQGPLLRELETRIANLLGKQQSMFFNKGTTCQLAALKTICGIKDNNRVILHPQSHIAQDEQDAYQALMGLEGVLVGQQDWPITLEDIIAADEPVAVLVIELPLRRAGFKLPEWDELLKMRQWCDENKVHFHLDGARLWESTHYYQKSLAEISQLFDSVYVSLYKGIGGIAGALLAGSVNFLQDCAVWRNRLGSNMYTTFPALITGLEGLDNNLPHIPSWVKRAEQITALLKPINGLIVDPPQTNGFQIKLSGNQDLVNQRLRKIELKYKMVICKPFSTSKPDGLLFTEIQTGAAHQKISDAEIVTFFNQLVA